MPDQEAPPKPAAPPPGDAPNGPGALERSQFSPEEKFLRFLSKFLRDRALYPERHPQIAADINAIQSALMNLFPDSKERTFAFVEDQLFVDDRLMTNAEKNLGEVLEIFNERKIDAFLLRPGLSWDEFAAFLSTLLFAKKDSPEKAAFCSPHIEIRQFSAVDSSIPVVPPTIKDLSASVSKAALGKLRFEDEAKMVRDIYADWNTVQGALVNLVVKIMNVLEKGLFENQQSFIPLANLKSYDEYTYVHAINLSILTMAQAESMGYPKEAVHAFGIGALLHDVGKTQVAEQILNKQGQLTPQESEEMKRHPLKGAMLLLQYPEIPPVSVIVAYEHHLKYDGSGYPSMKRKRTPHIASRFTSISDQFDAMRSNRPYREAMAPEKIFEAMQENRGTGLDPELLDNFLLLMKSKRFN